MTGCFYSHATVLEKIRYTKNIFAVILESASIAGAARPGNFVMIRDPRWESDPILNRPMSIARSDVNKGTIELQILISGKGTKLLSDLQQGDSLIVAGPLGTTFTDPDETGKTILVAGGIGIAPLIFYREYWRLSADNSDFLYGAANAVSLIPENYLPPAIQFCTDDGTKGYHGFVTERLKQLADSDKICKVLACGPTPMLKAVQHIINSADIPAELSVETPMGCGFGICLGCIVRKSNDRNSYLLACKDGPVFSAGEIILD